MSRANTLDNFRPIAPANFNFKIITKVLADRLAVIAAKNISFHQSGFIRGRHIKDCMCTTSKAINMLQGYAFGIKIALKFDIHEAFDTID